MEISKHDKQKILQTFILHVQTTLQKSKNVSIMPAGQGWGQQHTCLVYHLSQGYHQTFGNWNLQISIAYIFNFLIAKIRNMGPHNTVWFQASKNYVSQKHIQKRPKTISL